VFSLACVCYFVLGLLYLPCVFVVSLLCLLEIEGLTDVRARGTVPNLVFSFVLLIGFAVSIVCTFSFHV
jgi:hypothetical protein